MQEIELKLELDASQERRLRKSAKVRALSDGPAQTQAIWSIYYDTSEHDLRSMGIALRLRRVGGEWIQTLKRMTGEMQNGMSTPEEIEYPVAGQAIDLTRISDHDLREQMIGLARIGLQPVAETRFNRTKRDLSLPDGLATAEFAIDKGTLGLGEHTEPFVEAEFELKSGSPAALYDLALQVMPTGPIRFATASKSQRAMAIATGAREPALRKARPVDLTMVETVEDAAMLILTEGLGHFSPNLALVLNTEDPNGPHQMRVGLRRMRSALSAFRPVLGREALETVAADARDLAAQAGRIRDLDVLADEIIANAMRVDPDEPGYTQLRSAIVARRQIVRRDVETFLAKPERSLFPLRFAAFLARRAWVDGADHAQTARLAQPILPFAVQVLDKRWKAVHRWGEKIDQLSIDERHEMRKEVKKLRYMVDAFRSLFDPEDVAGFNIRIKRLQKAFGALNDSAMAEMVLMAPDAPGLDDPLAQRAVGKIVGRLQAHSDALWPAAIGDWHALSEVGRFWRNARL